MISYVKGTLAEITQDSVIIESGGFGINIMVPASVINSLPGKGADVKIFTYMNVREDDISLFGFQSPDDLGIFKLLINVSGIGPKGALAILSAMTPDELRLAVLTGDTAKISSAQGVGKKTAERAVLELKDKVSTVVPESFASGEGDASTGVTAETVQALVSLGIPERQAALAVSAVEDREDLSSEELIKEALKNI